MSRPPASALHVLTLTPFFPSKENEVGGCFVAEPIEALRQCGVHSSVIAVTPIHYPQKHSTLLSPADWLRYPQVPGNFGLASAGKLLYACLLRRVRKLHSTNPIHVIHAHGALPCGDAVRLLSRRLKIPFVVTLHGLDVFNTCYTGGTPASWRRKVSLEVYRAARTVICISGKVQAILKAGTPAETRSTVVYNGVDPNLFSSDATSLPSSATEILAVGNLITSKGHALLLRALGNLQPSFPNLRCRIIGEGPNRASLEALARELGIAQRVQFVGWQSRSQVAESMRRCSIFVLPSRNEGLGCVYLEAMSCGKPAIGCRGQGIDEVIEHGNNGWLITPDRLEELVQGLFLLLSSPEMCARMGAAARHTILERFTLSHQAQQLTSVYRQAIS